MSEGTTSQDGPPPQPRSSQDTTPTSPPPPPVPADDPKLVGQARTPPPLHHAGPLPSSQDLFKLSPIAALKLLSTGVEALVRITGDIPPTPPLENPTVHMRGFQKEKADIARSHSEKNLALLAEQGNASQEIPLFAPQPGNPRSNAPVYQPIDGVHLRHTPPPPAPPVSPEPYIVIGANSQPLNLQHSAITRKFYSKAPPPISIEEYLMRLHRWCPMSSAVYLAASLYIFRLAVDEKAIPVTRRNCHRLILAGLRVAMKALEDLSYPHAKFAKVGGVSEIELARLEISFCFLAGFELVVREENLRKHWEMLKNGTGLAGPKGGSLSEVGRVPVLRLEHRRKANASEVNG
ncbi:uncharacterized protein JN550_012009 [Neoarthrinium moseri]|uniref:uncharacterized protein n=1 Tax=Neoarthrinium moseri TaxID=1658444 RepID=UPI001FDD66AA|nr:uncharacterized protein JN550_012009 [Neoarthrinium moseri]KAI1859491.1 hypothetical protein JN550_012009 [Neoarthrinium moseri]